MVARVSVHGTRRRGSRSASQPKRSDAVVKEYDNIIHTHSTIITIITIIIITIVTIRIQRLHKGATNKANTRLAMSEI